MVALSRVTSAEGAMFEVSGEVSDFATWSEDMYFLEGGAGVDLTGISFQMQFRSNPQSSTADFTLSTSDGTLSIADDDNSVASIVRIDVTAGNLGSYQGDYIADLVAKDQADKVIHYAHGVVSFRNNPVAWG